MDYVVVKRLTEKSDLGWFRSIFYNRSLRGRQKAIGLNKEIINSIWPNLLERQAVYEAAKAAEKAARKPGGAGLVVAGEQRDIATVAGHLKLSLEIHGPNGKSPIYAERLMALQDKNWRLNGDFIEDPADDPERFDAVLREGDLALIGFNAIEWPTKATILLLAASTPDAALMSGLSPLMSKHARSMVRLDPEFLESLADQHSLPTGHVIRRLAKDPLFDLALEEIAQGDIAAGSDVRKRRLPTHISPGQLAAGTAAAAAVGHLGERMVEEFLIRQNVKDGGRHRWMWPVSAVHPYDFELFDSSGAVKEYVDAKSTVSEWRAEFYVSSAEIAYAADCVAPYRIFRLSEVGSTGAWLRISDDIRAFASVVARELVQVAPTGTRVVTIPVSPTSSKLKWSDPIRLPPLK